MPESSKSRFEILVELIKATVWPMSFFVVLIAFWGPLRDMAKELPAAVNRLTGVRAGPVELQFKQ